MYRAKTDVRIFASLNSQTANSAKFSSLPWYKGWRKKSSLQILHKCMMYSAVHPLWGASTPLFTCGLRCRFAFPRCNAGVNKRRLLHHLSVHTFIKSRHTHWQPVIKLVGITNLEKNSGGLKWRRIVEDVIGCAVKYVAGVCDSVT